MFWSMFSYLVKDYLGECCFVHRYLLRVVVTRVLFESGTISGFLVTTFASS